MDSIEIHTKLDALEEKNDKLEKEQKELYGIIMKYYPQDREFTDIQSALVYLLEERVDEIQNLAVKCDTLQDQLDMFKNKEA